MHVQWGEMRALQIIAQMTRNLQFPVWKAGAKAYVNLALTF